MKIVVIGDIILDTNHYCSTIRNAPEANIPVYNVISTNNLLGGAGNVANNLKNIECDIEFISVIGNDNAGYVVKQLLENRNIIHTLFTDNTRKTTHKNRLFCNDILINRYDIEGVMNISNEIENNIISYVKSLSNIDAIIFSDYNKGVLTPYICQELISYANCSNIFTFVDPKPNEVIKYKNCFCIKVNLIEGETISRKTKKNEILKYLKQYIECKHIILTCGENGLYVDSINYHINHSFPINVIDVTGCGDIVLVVISYMYLKTFDIINSSKIANYIARQCVSVIGNHLISTVDLDNVIDTIIVDTEICKLSRVSAMYKNIIFTNGCFDIIHSAHIQLLQFSKKLGDILIVGINSDCSVKRLKGHSRPINNINERCNLLMSLGIIDYIVIFNDDTPLNILKIIKPNIIVKGGDYEKENIIGKEYANEIVIFEYINGISSSNTIKKILTG